MKTLHLITVGKLRDQSLKLLEDSYLKRIKQFDLKIHEVKSCEENLDLEANELIKKITSISSNIQSIITLEEKGKTLDSKDFSKWLFRKLENSSSDIVFIIGGASGFSEKILQMKTDSISLSPMTFPHQMVRPIFIEQLYRATSIQLGHPYHK
jgi:23S rRNA (pseudouridine1915-N3)-methyltransferase